MKRTALEGSGILEGGLACFRIWAHHCWKFNLVRKYKVLRVEPCEVPGSQVWGWEVLLHRRIRLRVLEGGKPNEMKQHPGYLMYVLVMQDKILDASVCVIWWTSMDVYLSFLLKASRRICFLMSPYQLESFIITSTTTTTDITNITITIIVITIVTTHASS